MNFLLKCIKDLLRTKEAIFKNLCPRDSYNRKGGFIYIYIKDHIRTKKGDKEKIDEKF